MPQINLVSAFQVADDSIEDETQTGNLDSSFVSELSYTFFFGSLL